MNGTLAEGRDADSAMLLAWIDTAMIGVPLVGLLGLLLVPLAANTRICRRTKKVLGSSGLTRLGGWVELNFNNLTAVSVIERAATTLDKVLRERAPPESLPHVPVQTASQHNPYRTQESDRSEEEKN